MNPMTGISASRSLQVEGSATTRAPWSSARVVNGSPMKAAATLPCWIAAGMSGKGISTSS
jgi:hypothetical protein